MKATICFGMGFPTISFSQWWINIPPFIQGKLFAEKIHLAAIRRNPNLKRRRKKSLKIPKIALVVLVFRFVQGEVLPILCWFLAPDFCCSFFFFLSIPVSPTSFWGENVRVWRVLRLSWSLSARVLARSFPIEGVDPPFISNSHGFHLVWFFRFLSLLEGTQSGVYACKRVFVDQKKSLERHQEKKKKTI